MLKLPASDVVGRLPSPTTTAAKTSPPTTPSLNASTASTSSEGAMATTSTTPPTTTTTATPALDMSMTTPNPLVLEHYQRIMQQMGAQQAGAFFPPPPAGIMPPEMKDVLPPGVGHAPLAQCFYPDPYAGAYTPYGAMDGSRRKNATRETTQALKAWLYEHRKNPYPTKGEKIMLAIITKMSLTQVSTWFANARRRLKKENKMTWSPRNRPGEDDDDLDDIGAPFNDSTNDRPLSGMSDVSANAHTHQHHQQQYAMQMQQLMQHHASNPAALSLNQSTPTVAKSSPDPPKLESSAPPPAKKSKIWSIADQVAVTSTSSTGDRSDSSRATDKSDTEHKSPPPVDAKPPPAAALPPILQQQMAQLQAMRGGGMPMYRPMGAFNPAAMFTANPLAAQYAVAQQMQQMQAMQSMQMQQQMFQLHQQQQQQQAAGTTPPKP